MMVSEKMVREAIPKRDPCGHKGTFGRVFTLCGSECMFGAAILSAKASLRAGSGLVSVWGSEKMCQLVISCVPEVVGCIRKKDWTAAEAAALMNGNTVGVIGSGLGIEGRGIVREVVSMSTIPMIIDADGIRAVAEDPKLWNEIHVPFLITPHPGEMQSVCGLQPKEINRNREEIACAIAAEIGGIVLLKGKNTVISDGTQTYTIPTGNDGLATPGSGDVLAGLIGGLAAQGADLLSAAVAGAYLHGLAGELASAELSNYGVIATDILQYLPKAFVKVLKG